MLRVEEVHVLRHKVLVEGQSRRRVAREMGINRNTVRRYLTLSEPVRIEREPRKRPVFEAVPSRSCASRNVKASGTASKVHTCPSAASRRAVSAASTRKSSPGRPYRAARASRWSVAGKLSTSLARRASSPEREPNRDRGSLAAPARAPGSL